MSWGELNIGAHDGTPGICNFESWALQEGGGGKVTGELSTETGLSHAEGLHFRCQDIGDHQDLPHKKPV